MTPLPRSMPDATWPPLDSKHLARASTAVEEGSKVILASAANQRHVSSITDPSVPCLSMQDGCPEHPRCSVACEACTDVDVSATPDHADTHNYGHASEADHVSKASVNAGEPAAARVAKERAAQALQLEDCTLVPELRGQSSDLTQGSHPQQTSSEHVPGSSSMDVSSASLLSPAAGNGSSEEDSEAHAPCATLAAPRLQEQAQGPIETMHPTAAAMQSSTCSNGCLSDTIPATKSEVGVLEDSDCLEKGLSSSDSSPDACARDGTPSSVLLRNSGPTECRRTLPHQAHLQLHPKNLTSCALSQQKSSGTQQASAPSPSRDSAVDPESRLELQQPPQQDAELLRQSSSPQVFAEQLQYPGCDASVSPPQRTPELRMAMKDSYMNTQHARGSDTSQLSTTWQSASPDAVQPASFSLLVGDGCETSGRSPAQVAAATMPAEGSVASLPCWPHSAWPLCPSLGVSSMVLPPPSLQHLQHQLQQHLLPDWQATFSLPNIYFHNDHNGAERMSCSTPYDTGASPTPVVWPEGVDEPMGSYSPGGLWQPVPSALVKGNCRTSLHAGESFSSGHGTEDCNDNCSDCGRCRTQQWNPRMPSDQGYNSVLSLSQAATRWLQQAQQEITQRPQMQQYQQHDLCGSALRPALREALLSSSNTFHLGGREVQLDCKRRDSHIETDFKKINSTRGRSSGVYRRQLLQQLAVRHNQQQTRQPEKLSSLVTNDKVDATEIRGKEEDLSGKQAPAIPHGLNTEGEVGVSGDCRNCASASPEFSAVIEASDTLDTCVTAPAGPSPSLVAAAEARENPPEEGAVSHNTHKSYERLNATHAPRDEEGASGCADSSSTSQSVQTDDLCSLGQHMQWIVPPPEAAAALAAVRAAAASAAAAIAAEWQQHLEQHYLEDWMQQLSPAHQWWLLHLQQTDQHSIRNMPLYVKDWQEIGADANIAMSAVLDADARRIATCATLPTTEEQRRLLQGAGGEDKWTTDYNEQHPWQLHTSTFEGLMHPAFPSWSAVPPGAPTPATGTQQGAEGACWQDVPEPSVLRKQQTAPHLRNSSKYRIHPLHLCARAGRCDQGNKTTGELMQQWEPTATCPFSTAVSPEVIAWSGNTTAFAPQRPRQQRQNLRIVPRSMARLSLSEHAEVVQLRANAHRSTPNRSGRKWRRTYRGQLAEECCREVQICRKPDVYCPVRSSCCSACCVDVVSSSCNRCTFRASASGCGRRRAKDSTAAVELLHSSEAEETCRLQSVCGHERDLSRSVPRWGKKAAGLETRTPASTSMTEGSTLRQIEFPTQSKGRRLISRSCSLPCTRNAIEGTARQRRASLGSVPQADFPVIAKLGGSSAVKTDPVTRSRYALLDTEPLRCKAALKCRQTEQGAEGAEHQTMELLPTCCTNHTAASSQTALLSDKSTAHSTNRVSLMRPPVRCACDEKCVHGWARRSIAGAAASTPSSGRRSRYSERLRAAGHNLSCWISGGKCRTCQAGSRRGSGKDAFYVVTQNSGRNSNVGGMCGKAFKMEEGTHADLAGDEQAAPETWPLPSKRESAAEGGYYRAPPRSHCRAHVRSLERAASPKGAEQKETNETSDGRARRGDRRC